MQCDDQSLHVYIKRHVDTADGDRLRRPTRVVHVAFAKILFVDVYRRLCEGLVSWPHENKPHFTVAQTDAWSIDDEDVDVDDETAFYVSDTVATTLAARLRDSASPAATTGTVHENVKCENIQQATAVCCV